MRKLIQLKFLGNSVTQEEDCDPLRSVFLSSSLMCSLGSVVVVYRLLMESSLVSRVHFPSSSSFCGEIYLVCTLSTTVST